MRHLLIVLSVLLLATASAVAGDETPSAPAAAGIPAAWQSAWQQPPLADRPLQIVHGMPVDAKLSADERTAVITQRLDSLLSHGLGGIVCNMPFENYLQSDHDWESLAATIEQCRTRGLVVWIYDELGYPSGSAGGLVLQENPAFEALELAFDAGADEPFIVRPSYEYTHASNNYHAARRYVNLLDADAVACFVRKTHDAYWNHLEPLFGDPIVAMFTDEPSLLAMSLGQLPESVRRTVRVVDEPDPNVKQLPAVPWCRDMADQYRARFKEDLLAQRRSLFEGGTDLDRRVRRQFWSLVSDLLAERFFGALEKWCEQRGVASTGHTLVEESLLLQLAVEGNGLQALSRMHMPGLDALSSDPEAVIHSGWLTAGLPASAAALSGRRRVMTEVSDFVQKMGGSGPASLADMQATAAWQATWGVTEFTLYYSQNDRSVEDYRAYCEFVGRLNAILKPATPVADVLLYYPMYDLWSEYRPVAEQLSLGSQSPKLQQITASFMQLGQSLQRSQTPFVLIDHRALAEAQIDAQGTLAVGGRTYRSIVLPEGVTLPEDAARNVALVNAHGATPRTEPTYRIEPASPHVAVGTFVRDEHPVLLLVNVGREDYAGRLSVAPGYTWQAFDPANGSVKPVEADKNKQLPIPLAARQAILLVGSRQ